MEAVYLYADELNLISYFKDKHISPNRSVICQESTELVRMRSPVLLHEVADEHCDLICCGVEGEMASIDDVDFGFGDVAAVGFRF